ncbi:MAG: DNA polymerase III subunit alpha [Bacilli bacterium]
MYTPLNIKTENSILSSLIKIDDLIDFALKNNIKSLTITDNKMYGAYYFYKKCRESGINPIIGLDLIVDGVNVILYCKNYDGYKNLLKLVSLDSVGIDDINTYSGDLICIVPFNSFSLYDRLSKIFSDIFIGYKDKNEMSKLNYDNLVYMDEILCLEKGDLKYLSFLDSIKSGVSVSGIDKYDTNYLVLNVGELYPEYIDNNYKIGNMCDLEIKLEHDLLPKFDCPDGMDSYSYLKKLCVDGLKKIFGDTVSKKYAQRIKYELGVINKMGFCNYFLVVSDYVAYAKSQGILVGPGRGSAAGSLVSYVLGITTIDPIKYNLLFERFLNPERVTMPDIDIDFEFTRRQEVVDYCINKYGVKRVCPIITFGTLGAKQSIRDVGRSLEIPLKTIDRLCSMIDSKLDLKKNYDSNIKIKNFLSTDKELVNLYRVASRLEGLKRHTSIHAAGIVMSSCDLDEIIPLDNSHDFYTTGYSMEFLEELGLLKMDFLALKNLTLINDVLKEVGISFDDIPNDDSETFKLFQSGDTNGVFQFESSGMISFLKKFKPSSFEDIVSSIALYRPGPMSNIDSFIKRKRGIEKIDYIDSSLEPILKSTYGIIVYQEQIMMIAQVMAGFSFGEADILRRAMSKKKESLLIALKDKFIEGCLSLGYDKDKALKVYELILKFASYGFNRAHSVSYAMISYRIAYLKVHFPLIFMKHLLNSNIGGEVKTREYVYECKSRGFNILKPDINISWLEYVLHDGYLVYPLTSIKGIGYQSVLKIIESRSVPFKDIFDFIKRCSFKSIGRDVFTSLVFAGCFETFGYNKRTLIENLDKILNYSDLGDILGDDLLPILDEYPEYDSKFLMEKEFEIFGFYVSNHPVTSYKEKYNSIDLCDISNYFDKIINIVVYVDRVKEVETKKGDKMCFITGSDEVSSIDVVFFPKVYTGDINAHDILYLNGRVEKRNDEYQFVVNGINEIIR